MAITHIHAITKTVNKAIGYGVKDKVGKLRSDIHDSIAYALKDKGDEVTYFTLNSYQHCTRNTAIKTFEKYSIKKMGRKKPRTKNGEEVLAWHLVQSFEEQISPQMANEIGCKLANEIFNNFACTISTHTNTENTHNHIIVCAWDRDGKKWNNCNTTYKNIRKVSDRLCEEYGLNVLENTKDVKLIKWKDNEGNTRYFEPTVRKIDLIKKRERGELADDDVGSYRHYPSYAVEVERKISNGEIIKNDIDALLPSATSYEYLLDKLREIGYEIKDKKKNGDWMSHVSFKAPTQRGATRDYKIGEFYTRENLTAHIEKLARENQTYGDITKEKTNLNEQEDSLKTSKIEFLTSYDYGQFNISLLNENYRVRRTKDGNYENVKRGEAERAMIRDIKKIDKELYGLYDTTVIEKAIAENKKSRRTSRPVVTKRREQILVNQIQESFENLRFIERKNISSYEQINDTVKVLWTKYNQCLNGINIANDGIEHLKYILSLPNKVLELEKVITENKDDNDYIDFELSVDKNLLENYKEQVKKYKLDIPEVNEVLSKKVKDSQKRLDVLNDALHTFSVELNSYDRCVRTLKRIDRENDRSNEKVMQKYDAIKAEGEMKKHEQKNDANRQKREEERR